MCHPKAFQSVAHQLLPPVVLLDSGAGLEDLEDILSAPCPALGTPLRQAHRGREGQAGQLDQPAACVGQTPTVQAHPLEHVATIRSGEGGGNLILPADTAPDQAPVTASCAPATSVADKQLADRCHVFRGSHTEVDTGWSTSGQQSAQQQGCRQTSSAPCHDRYSEDGAPHGCDGSRRRIWQSIRKTSSYEGMTVAASLVGAVAGGAAAGPLGLSLGIVQTWQAGL